MAPPTPDEIYAHLTDTIEPAHPEHTVFEFEHLVTRVRRHFKSTTPAIEERLGTLVQEGRLKPVRIHETGTAHIVRTSMEYAYFTYELSYGIPSGHGTISFARPEDRRNPWASGTRNLYLSQPRHDALVAAFTEHKNKVTRKREEEEKAEQREVQARLAALDGRAPDTLQRLMDELPELDLTVRRGSVGDRMLGLFLNALGDEQVSQLIGILRRGLDAGREQDGEAR